MGRLDDAVCVITGAASGIGLATAKTFAREGAHVAVFDVNDAAGRAVAEDVTSRYGKPCRFFYVDVTDEDSVREGFSRVMDYESRVDVLMNCAGGSAPGDGPLTEANLEVWERTYQLDVLGTILACRAAIPLMADGGGGAIVNVSSTVALSGSWPLHIYGSAKGAIISLTRSIAGHYAAAGVRANAIAPGVIRTERVAGRLASALTGTDTVFDAIQRRAADYPFATGLPEDIANIALFLASNESRMITGATLPADGGASAY